MTVHVKNKEVAAEAVADAIAKAVEAVIEDIESTEEDTNEDEPIIELTDIDPPPYGILAYDLQTQYPSEYTGFNTIRGLKKGIDDAINHTIPGEMLMIVELKYIIVPMQDETDEDFTISEKENLGGGLCPICMDVLRWDDAEDVWMCDQCTCAYDPEHVGVEPPVKSTSYEAH